MKKALSVLLSVCLIIVSVSISPLSSTVSADKSVNVTYISNNDSLEYLMEQYTKFIVVKHKQLGGSHYSYTEAVSDTYDASSPATEETTMFRPGSQLVLAELEDQGDTVKRTETVLLESTTGVIRDPDVSEDGTRVLFSWKKAEKTDDYHIYEYDLITDEVTQLTFGLGAADTEPRYLPNGNIVFSSTRDIQTVDCWKTPVSNLYICGPNGENIVRVGYDQVHTTYPTVTSDGRVLYTRWDYNDRTQMYVQGVFQMFPDGTNQTEVFGNGSLFPTSFLHTREIPGSSDKYITIISGHHTWQHGKLAIIDTSKGRNTTDAVTYPFVDDGCNYDVFEDYQGTTEGAQYKYPYALDEDHFLVSYAPNGMEGTRMSSDAAATPFSIYFMDTDNNKTEIIAGSTEYPASQCLPIAEKTLFERASMVNYASSTGTYYIGNIYEGDGLKDVEVGTAKYLRVVALDFRSYAIGDTIASSDYGFANIYSAISTGRGSWDVKHVLGIVPIEADGSVLFKVPSETPVYFQVLDGEGQAIQTMRSWSTLMPGETFSCVGCHEDKNTVPPAASTTTLAMAKGVQELQPDLWQSGEDYEEYDPYSDSKGFDYLEEIQPILDENCVQCHNDQSAAFTAIDAASMTGCDTTIESENDSEIIDVVFNATEWKYLTGSAPTDAPSSWNTADFDDSSWSSAMAPFGDRYDRGSITTWSGTDTYIWIRKTFNIENTEELLNAAIELYTFYDDNPEFYINGIKFYEPDDWVDDFTTVRISSAAASEAINSLKVGKNVFAIYCKNTTGGRMIDSSLSFIKAGTGVSEKTAFSLEDRMMGSSRMSKAMPLSYLVLTGSKTNALSYSWVAPSTEGPYLNWVSCMSGCEMLEPYSFGSSKSNLISMLESGHNGVTLTQRQMYALKAWIDLAVPCFGDYETGNIWNSNEQRWADEYTNKRNLFNTLNSLSRKSLANSGTVQDISIVYKQDSTTYSDTTDFSGAKRLDIPTYYKSGDTVTVTLPEGEKYLGLTLDNLMGEAIIYAPSSVYTFTVPSDLQPYNRTFKVQNNKTIIARVVSDEELLEHRNLALNPYDLTSSDSYPHAVTDSAYANNGQFIVRNAIDGITANDGHGAYPNHSWGPDQGNNHWMTVDFGREVCTDSLTITIRADFPHDTYFETATLEFYDENGNKIDSLDIALEKTSEPQTFNFDPVNCYSVKLTSLTAVDVEGNDWAAISEFEIFGTDVNVIDWKYDTSKRIIYGIAEKTSLSEFKAGFDFDTAVLNTESGTVTDGNVSSGMTVRLNNMKYTVIVDKDLNGDGSTNIIDLIRMKRKIAEGSASKTELYASDSDSDGLLSAKDITALVKYLLMR